ncbi:class I transcription factor A, subunit 3 [Trypanosoma equiperdum]|uniref:Class I transcription factor A, subunit 3 n=1 Tax=Trypanosoma equiperdum TaxID=5694 RepID=A0A1G4IG09_TRYEQ|nr:class I transcription factor A, subunit 3 [Trypanosoma equiperdum]
MSHRISSTNNPFSERDFNLLKSGALEKSRSVVSRREQVWDNIVDVGEGVKANDVEELMARLEQHGLRRVLAENEGGTGALHAADGAHGTENCDTSTEDIDEDDSCEKRAPYYYMCVPCELSLTEISTKPATMRMLQDAHYHFSSAEHRCIASWMGVVDIEKTLAVTSRLEVGGYIRIFVNGIPFLISARPGGGGMFYPLPHETVEAREQSGRNAEPSKGTAVRKEIWYRPLQSVFTRCKQILYTAASRQKLRGESSPFRAQRRNGIVLLHIPMKTYERESFIRGPSVPALFEVQRERVSNKKRRHKDNGTRTCYVMRERPIAAWEDEDDSTDAISKVTVKEEGVYRLVLLCSDDVRRSMRQAEEEEHEPETRVSGEVTHPLTVEALQMIGGTTREESNQSDGKSLSYDSSSWSRKT